MCPVNDIARKLVLIHDTDSNLVNDPINRKCSIISVIVVDDTPSGIGQTIILNATYFMYF